MIYTVTFNPAIDYVVRSKELVPGCVNRADGERIFVGGKGINVSFVLAELGVVSKTLGFTAGFTGRAIEEGVCLNKVEADFVRLKNGNSRINVKINSGVETELNGQGPDIDDEAIAALFKKLEKLQNGDVLVLAGSIPKSLPDDIYERILAAVSDRRIRTVVDASGRLLTNVLKYRPFLVKPNVFELAETFGTELRYDEDVRNCAAKLIELGARNVLVSMAADGAMLLDDEGGYYRVGACKGVVKNSVGAGDSMLAGFIAGLDIGDKKYALKLGTACGGATTFSDGLAKKELVDELMKSL